MVGIKVGACYLRIATEASSCTVWRHGLAWSFLRLCLAEYV